MEWLRGEYPNLQLHIKRVIAEGDLVATHAHLDLERVHELNQVDEKDQLPVASSRPTPQGRP